MAIRLASETIPQSHLNDLADWLRSGPKLTKGELTVELEEKFAEKVGTKYSVFVNSGSSANLLMIAYLKYCYNRDISNNQSNNIIVPAVSWATDVAPVLQLGFNPILVDCMENGLNLDLEQLEFAMKKYKPLAMINVSILGFVENMQEIKYLCKKYDVVLLEDNCESLLSQGAGKYGLMSSYSTYYGHHISTVEGGFITTNHRTVQQHLLMLRSHGWTRDCSDDWKRIIADLWPTDEFTEKYTFYVPGFNVRNTDIGAFLGLKQLEVLDEYVENRNNNWVSWWHSIPSENTHTPVDGILNKVSNFALPLMNLPNRQRVVDACIANDIECRPLVAGSMSKQPMVKRFVNDIFYTPNANKLHDSAMYLPNHADITEEEIRFMANIVRKAI